MVSTKLRCEQLLLMRVRIITVHYNELKILYLEYPIDLIIKN